MNKRLFSGEKVCIDVRKELNWDIISKMLQDPLYSAEIKVVAKMVYHGTEFWAVNGIGTSERRNIKALQSIIPIADNHICRINGQSKRVKYYHFDHSPAAGNQPWTVITYANYQNSIKTNRKSIKELERLFSCAERKLIAHLKNETDKFTMYIAFPPCYMCENAFRYLLEANNDICNFMVYYCEMPESLETQCTNHLKSLNLVP